MKNWDMNLLKNIDSERELKDLYLDQKSQKLDLTPR